MVKSVALIGNGKMGSYLHGELQRVGLRSRLYAREPQKGQLHLKEYKALESMSILCVKDDAIAPLSSELPSGAGLLVHCSGATPLETIDEKHARRGIWYPLMSIRKAQNPTIDQIPFCIEAQNSEDYALLEKLCELIGARSHQLNSTQRAYLHLAAVFANNFSQHLYHLSYRILKKENLDFSILKPLLHQQVLRLDQGDPAGAQTGPAVRKDQLTINKHLQLLDDPQLQELYQALSLSIMDTHEKEL
jgi:predicted short-subunit dehydrogenase-like oxidoreductase (DUF2520 family)